MDFNKSISSEKLSNNGSMYIFIYYEHFVRLDSYWSFLYSYKHRDKT